MCIITEDLLSADSGGQHHIKLYVRAELKSSYMPVHVIFVLERQCHSRQCRGRGGCCSVAAFLLCEWSRMGNGNAQWKNHPHGGSFLQGSDEQPSLTAKSCIPPRELFIFECRSESPCPRISSGPNEVVWPLLFCRGLQDNKTTGISYLETPATKSTW